MITVYQANSSFDAKLIQDQLSFADIQSHTSGELLQGGMGELQAFGLVRVMVDETDLEKAKKVIEDWERKPISKEKIKPRMESLVFSKQKSNKTVFIQLAITVIILSLLMKFAF